MANPTPDHHDPSHQETPDRESDTGGLDFRTAFRWAGLAFEIVAVVAATAFVGYLFDRWLGASPWGFVIGMALGLIIGFYNFIKQTFKAMR